MRTIVQITDTHFRTKSPLNRNDDILESLMVKFEWCLEFAAERNAEIIHTGDLFHTPSVPDQVANRIVRLFKKYNSRVHYIIGNHDVTGGNCEAIDYSKVGLLAEYPWFTLLAKEPVIYDDCILTGYDFSKAMECPEIIDPVKDFNLKDIKVPLICCVHSMIVDEPHLFVDGKFKTINWGTVNCTADILLTGHFHPGWSGIRENAYGVRFINPGAMTRQEASKTDINRKPQLTLIKIKKKDVDIRFVEIPHKKDVFNLEVLSVKSEIEEEKNRFIEALESLKGEDLMGLNVTQMLQSMKVNEVTKEFLDDEIVDMCKKKLEEILNG